MAAFTQLAIRKTFLLLLESTPLDKITVKMIVDACGVSRNTFYYHYADIPALLKDTLEHELGSLSTDSAQRRNDGLQLLAKINSSRRIMDHIYHSSARDQLQKRLWEVTLQAFQENVFQLSGEKLSPAIRDSIAVYFASAAIGICLHWLEHNTSDHPEDLQAQFSLFDGLLEQTVQRALSSGFCDSNRTAQCDTFR